MPKSLKIWLYANFAANYMQALAREFFIDQKFMSSFPLISGDTFRSICDLSFDDDTDLNELIRDVHAFESSNSPKIFINGKSRYYELFKECEKHEFKKKLKFIYHNDDQPLRLDFSSRLIKRHDFYSVNTSSFAITNIPLGLENLRECRYGKILNYTNSDVKLFRCNSAKDSLVLLNFREETNLGHRSGVLNLAKKFDFVKIANKVDIISNIRNIQSSYFVLSPAGNGIDCYRNFEAMYLGAVPVVQKAEQLPYMVDLPILIVDSYADFLELSFSVKVELFMSFHNRSYPKLHFDYWRKLIDES
jgi:hypothetical protein